MNFFMPMCLEFQRLHPKVTLEMDYLGEAEILDSVQQSKMEFGIISHPPIIEGLAAYPVLKQKIALLAPAGFKGSSKTDLEEAPFVTFEKTDALLSELWNKQISKRKKPKIAIVVNSHRSMLDAVSQNKCLAVLPLMSAQSSIQEGKVKALSGYEFEIPLYLIHPQGEWMPRKNLAFKQFILKRCKEWKESV